MAEWNKNKVESSAINGGKEFTTDDVLTLKELNSMVNNSFYGVDFVEAMADQPDVSEIANTGTPNVSLVNNIKNGKVFKKFKFSNLRGEKGLQGDKGDTGDKGEKGDKGDPNTLTIGSVSSGETASATITGTAPNQVLNLVLPKGEKGDKGDTGNISSLDTELSDTSTNAVQNKVIKNALDKKMDAGAIVKTKELNLSPLSENITSWDEYTHEGSYPYYGLTQYKKVTIPYSLWNTVHNTIQTVGLVNVKSISFEGFPTSGSGSIKEEFFNVLTFEHTHINNWGYYFISGHNVVELDFNNGSPYIIIHTLGTASIWSAGFKIKNLYYF